MRIFFISNSTPASITWERKSCANYHANYRIFSSQYQGMIAHPFNLFPPAQKNAKTQKESAETACSSDFGTFWRRRGDSNPRTVLPAYSLSRGAPYSHLGTSASAIILKPMFRKKWRREWDSNPRLLTSHRFSRPAP